MDDVNTAKELLERFCRSFGWRLELYEDLSEQQFTLWIRNKEGEGLKLVRDKLKPYVGYEDLCIRATSELLCYNAMLDKIIGRRLLMYKNDYQADIEYTGVFARSVNELELKLAVLGY